MKQILGSLEIRTTLSRKEDEVIVYVGLTTKCPLEEEEPINCVCPYEGKCEFFSGYMLLDRKQHDPDVFNILIDCNKK